MGTWGRGVWQRIVASDSILDDLVPVEPAWRLRQLRVDLPNLWASNLIARSNHEIRELRLLGHGGGRAFRRGDEPLLEEASEVLENFEILIGFLFCHALKLG